MILDLRPEWLTAIGCSSPAMWMPHLERAMNRFGIASPERASQFLAQCAHESAGFTRMEENLNYSARGLLDVFPKHFTPQEAELFARQPERIASRVYANRLGNGPEASGHGWKYRGRGLIQITGLVNYKACGDDLVLALVEHPEMLARPEFAALSAAWYWHDRGLNRLADAGDFEHITRAINGGTNGLEDRARRLLKVAEAMKACPNG